MSIWFVIVTVLFMLVALAMVLIILVQRPQGGGLAGAFGGTGGSGTDTVFGGRVGDALTVATVVAFVLYLSLAIGLNILDNVPAGGTTVPAGGTTPATTPSPDEAVPIVDSSDSDQSNDDNGGER